MSDNAIRLGPYAQGEIPEPVTYTFLLASGSPDALLPPTFTAKLEYRRWNAPVPVTEKAATVLDQVVFAGQVTWSWAAPDVAAFGDFEGELWVGNGTNRYRSQRFRWVITPAVFAPTI